MTFHDEYEILDISEGSYAIVYKARHKRLGYVRAVKELKTAVLNEDDKAYQTFLKECQMLMQIGNGNCPGIVKMYNPRLLGNRAVVEMDYVQGETLTQYLNRHQFMPIAEVMRMISDIGGALAYCHHDIYRFLMSAEADHLQRNPDNAAEFVISKQKERELVEKYRVVHNDLHSGNVMRREQDGGFVLLDFGLAIQNGKAVKSSDIAMGAIEYRAPEKWDMSPAVKPPPQCDIYSWGILLFEALTGRVPFKCDLSRFASELAAKNEMRRLHCEAPVPAIEPLRRAAFERAHPGEKWVKDYPDWLEAMVMKCLAKNPEDRYADASELMHDFDRHVADDRAKGPSLSGNARPKGVTMGDISIRHKCQLDNGYGMVVDTAFTAPGMAGVTLVANFLCGGHCVARNELQVPAQGANHHIEIAVPYGELHQQSADVRQVPFNVQLCFCDWPIEGNQLCCSSTPQSFVFKPMEMPYAVISKVWVEYVQKLMRVHVDAIVVGLKGHSVQLSVMRRGAPDIVVSLSKAHDNVSHWHDWALTMACPKGKEVMELEVQIVDFDGGVMATTTYMAKRKQDKEITK